MSHRIRGLFALLFILGSGCAVGCGRITPHEAAAANEPTGTAPAADRVVAGPPVRKTLQLYTTQPGRIEAFEVAPLYAKLAGYVEEVLVDIGDRVQKDQPLVRLWIPELHDDVTQRGALVGQAEAELEQSKAAVTAAEAAAATAAAYVTQTKAGIVRATGEHDRWKAEYRRIEQLAASGSLTAQLVDETRNQLSSADAAAQEANAAVVSAEATLSQRQADIQKCQSDVRAAEARLRVAQAVLARSQTLLRYAEIRAPFDGVITRRNIDTGHFVQPADGRANPLLVVERMDVVRIFVDVPELEAAQVDTGAEGDSVRIQIQGLSGREVEGRVTRTSWSLDELNRSLLTEIDLSNSDGALRPGMYAMATILLDERTGALTVPATAILREGRQAYCYCVRDEYAVRCPVTTGLRVGADIEITSGLSTDDTVVQLRADTLRDGQPVEVLPPATP